MTALAPLNVSRDYKGTVARKPWEYDVTVTLPHLDTPHLASYAIDLWRQQTVDPYFLLVDTGSPPEVCKTVEAFRADDCEVHYIRGHAWEHPSENISAACDLAMALCRTPQLFFTHTDVFVKNSRLLETLLSQCDADNPVVGYEISPRNEVQWEGMVGHTALMVSMLTMFERGITWSLQRGKTQFGFDFEKSVGGGWPDTEATFNLLLKDLGITPLIVGHEGNNFHEDDNLVHCRNYTGTKTYKYPGIEHREQWVRETMARMKYDASRRSG